MGKNEERVKYKANQSMHPNRRQKYYLKNRWIFAVVAVIAVVFISLASAYFSKQQSDAEYIAAQVIRVIDGDTIVVAVKGKEERVRMIGLDAPESVSAEESENSVYGELASEYTRQKLKEGTTVYLTFDEEKTDQYGRMLAYVWLDKDFENIESLYQRQMIRDGYAFAIKFEPNTMYWQILHISMQEAINSRVGLWAEDTFYDENKGKFIL